jgi:hypothetical protein
MIADAVVTAHKQQHHQRLHPVMFNTAVEP